MRTDADDTLDERRERLSAFVAGFPEDGFWVVTVINCTLEEKRFGGVTLIVGDNTISREDLQTLLSHDEFVEGTFLCPLFADFMVEMVSVPERRRIGWQ